jgi:uncharacterized protein YqfA (UPF0365 family)
MSSFIISGVLMALFVLIGLPVLAKIRANRIADRALRARHAGVPLYMAKIQQQEEAGYADDNQSSAWGMVHRTNTPNHHA